VLTSIFHISLNKIGSLKQIHQRHQCQVVMFCFALTECTLKRRLRADYSLKVTFQPAVYSQLTNAQTRTCVAGPDSPSVRTLMIWTGICEYLRECRLQYSSTTRTECTCYPRRNLLLSTRPDPNALVLSLEFRPPQSALVTMIELLPLHRSSPFWNRILVLC
jgi:hypothetical protein